jgi:hypothetical protein
MSRRSEGRSLQLGFSIAVSQARRWMADELRMTQAAIAGEIQDLHRELTEARAELDDARREIARLQ